MSLKLIPVYLLHFINFFNLMLWGPIMEPILAQQKVSDPRLKLILNGLIIAAYPLAQFFAIHPLNSWSDRIGKRRVLFYTQAGTVLSILISIIALSVPALRNYSWTGVSLGVWLIIFSRIVDGISGGNAMVTNNYANDIINSEGLDKAKAFPSIELSMMAGSLSGVFIGPIFGQSRFGTVGALYLILFISIVGLYVIYNQVTNVKQKENTKLSLKEDFNLLAQLQKIKGYPEVQETLMYRAVFQFLFMSFITSIFIFMKNQLGIEGSELSTVMFIVAIITVISIIVVVPRIIKIQGIDSAFQTSKYLLLGGLLSFFFVSFIPDDFFEGLALLGAYFVLVSGVAVALSLFKHFLTNTMKVEKQGQVIALEEQVIILSAFLGATTTGFVSALIKSYELPAQTLFLYFFVIGVIYLGVNKLTFRRKI
jgi:MFS transporter, DHA1 family, tetracycline resistance protein